MQDASYAKLRNLQVGYSLPKQLISKYGISRLRVYCSIDNLFMISGFDGVDPEAISGNYYPSVSYTHLVAALPMQHHE